MADGAEASGPGPAGRVWGWPAHIERSARHFDPARSGALAGEGPSPRGLGVLTELGRAGTPYRLSRATSPRAGHPTSGAMSCLDVVSIVNTWQLACRDGMADAAGKPAPANKGKGRRRGLD